MKAPEIWGTYQYMIHDVSWHNPGGAVQVYIPLFLAMDRWLIPALVPHGRLCVSTPPDFPIVAGF